MTQNIQEAIKNYWEDENTVSLLDINLRKLEEGVVKKYLEANQDIIDIGCGDASSTVAYASEVKSCLGLERSNHLRTLAEKKMAESNIHNVTLVQGDIMTLDQYKNQFDLAITQRVLINLTSWEQQMQAIQNVRSVLKPDGIYVMIENTYEGQNALNTYRQAMGLKDISVHWHNLYFHHTELIEYLSPHFAVVSHHTFDLYYLLTRIYTNLFASFEGFGKTAVKDPIFDTADVVARRLFETVGENVRIGTGPSFGPIQAFVLKRIN